MHIPDNYLSPSTCAVMGAAMIPVWTVAVRKVKHEMTRAKMPMLGIGSAFAFLLMMFNIPLPGGTTGHAVGGTLIAILIGPFSACISVSVALLIQALLFGDGGVLALGANCFNMAFVMPFAGYFVYKFIKDRTGTDKSGYIGMALGSYVGINIAALFAAIEFGIQPLLFINAAGQPLYSPYPLSVSIPAMLIPHVLVAGFAEAAFTVSIFAFIKKVSPETIYKEAKTKLKAVYGFVAALICLAPIGLLAAGTAWGEWGADEIGKSISGGKALGYVPDGMIKGFDFKALIPDYTVSGLPDAVAYIFSAAAGTAVLIILFKVIGSLRKGKTGERND
jgi:cobalt/nickel transport system permease protein